MRCKKSPKTRAGCFGLFDWLLWPRTFLRFFHRIPAPPKLAGFGWRSFEDRRPKTEDRRLNAEAQRLNARIPEYPDTANPWGSRNSTAELFWHILGAKYGPSQHGVCASSYEMHSEHKIKAKLQACAPRVCGIRQHANNTRRRRVSGWVLKKLQKGAWPQKPVKPAKVARACFRRFFAAPTPSAALASHLCKFPQSETRAHQLGIFPRAPH